VILGNISDAIENLNEEETQLERGLDELQLNLKYNKVPNDMQEKVVVFMQYCHNENIKFNQKLMDFSYLSNALRKDLLCHEYEKLQKNVALFSALNKATIFDICSHFRYIRVIRIWIYLPGDTIVTRGDVCTEFCYIKKGRVKVIDPINGNTSILEEGQCFNELSFVFDSIVLNTVQADDFCILDVLTRESYNEILEERPTVKHDIKAGLKMTKTAETTGILTAMREIPFFVDFSNHELKHMYTEYMDVIYVNPNSLVTAPSHKCNGLYFILQGSIGRYKRSEDNYEYIKSRVLKDDQASTEDCDTFVQQIDLLERKKKLEETQPCQLLKSGDWLGSSF
jgi:CRP-like cAMP-binding protein